MLYVNTCKYYMFTCYNTVKHLQTQVAQKLVMLIIQYNAAHHWLVGDATVFLETRLALLLLNFDQFCISFLLIDLDIPAIESISYFLLHFRNLVDISSSVFDNFYQRNA